MDMKNIYKSYLILFFVFGCQVVQAKNINIRSLDGKTNLQVSIGDKITWSVKKYGVEILPEVHVDLLINDQSLNRKYHLKSHHVVEQNSEFELEISLKNKRIKNQYKELQLKFNGGFGLHFRVFNDGIAYRFHTTRKEEILVHDEVMDIRFPEETHSFFPQEKSTYSHYERSYVSVMTDSIDKGDFCSIPVLFSSKKNNIRLLYSEADVYDYPNMFLQATGDGRLRSMFPKVVSETIPQPGRRKDRNVLITKEEPYIARTEGKRTFPWRFFLITNDDKTLLEQDMVMKLSRPTILKDLSWIKPGKVAWDWWNDNNLYGVEFKSGLNTATYKYFIDFAAEYGLEYVILDEGWTKSTKEILDFNPEMDVKELIRYGEEKGVGIILWCLWKPLDENMKEILDTYKGWGAKGIKVDFMQRADQYMVNSYESIAEECAKRKLLVDFHGAFKPSGLRRAYPNVVSYEGVKGNEHNKWSKNVTPDHNTLLPFIRMAVGPMDYTPGAMINTQEENFNISFSSPMSMGTRCHQLAMYVVFESPLQMLCDSPSNYYKEEECTRFIAQFPTVWEKTIALNAKLGEHLVLARQNGDNWYVGGMTNWQEREIELDFGFLPKDTVYEAVLYMDGENANRQAQDYTVKRFKVKRDSKLTIMMARGGGFACILKPSVKDRN